MGQNVQELAAGTASSRGFVSLHSGSRKQTWVPVLGIKHAEMSAFHTAGSNTAPRQVVMIAFSV